MMKINMKVAKSFIGTPYVWGGESLKEGGFDCSGFVYNVLIGSGVSVPRDTAQGYYNRYKNHEVSGLMIHEGDLLFFGKSRTSISHIAIAVSSAEMIESVGTKKNTINNKGKGVSINKISRRKDKVAVVRFSDVIKSYVTPSANPNLKRGSMGRQVEYLQIFLNHFFKCYLTEDGIFGNETYRALKRVQSACGLQADGIYGNHTRSVFLNLNR